ncbi:MAG: restriction endonuclease [Balneolaceae bacterium]|nr:restriction endonuclease [Balneolaceae bacterium]
MLIENPIPDDWKALQESIKNIFQEIGYSAETEKNILTPRGNVKVDVYAIDKSNVDEIKYVIECKNWNSRIPQSIVHSFMTLMNETGCNKGIIVSKKGLQKGAREYIKNTNIIGLSFTEFQLHYYDMWYKMKFSSKLDEVSDSLIQYVEPFNSRRTKETEKLSLKKQTSLIRQVNKYELFGIIVNNLVVRRLYVTEKKRYSPDDALSLKMNLENSLQGSYRFKSEFLRDFLDELTELIYRITTEFDSIFARNIFPEK